MTNVQPYIGSSISPVSQHDADHREASSERKELVEIDEKQKEEFEPAPRERDGEDEEFRQPKIGRRPMALTKAELDEQYLLNMNYKSWCQHCRAGKAR